jgi:hypothetical protein
MVGPAYRPVADDEIPDGPPLPNWINDDDDETRPAIIYDSELALIYVIDYCLRKWLSNGPNIQDILSVLECIYEVEDDQVPFIAFEEQLRHVVDHKYPNISEDTIEKISEAELDFKRSIGLVIEAN